MAGLSRCNDFDNSKMKSGKDACVKCGGPKERDVGGE